MGWSPCSQRKGRNIKKPQKEKIFSLWGCMAICFWVYYARGDFDCMRLLLCVFNKIVETRKCRHDKMKKKLSFLAATSLYTFTWGITPLF